MTAAGSDPHLEPLALDALLVGEGSAEARAHLERCDSCREALLDLQSFTRALKSRDAKAGTVPREVDRTLLAMARRELDRVRPRRVFRVKVFRVEVLAAAAALILASAGIWFAFRGPEGPGGSSGRVDIVDAYLLALRISSGASASLAWDVNQDGVVDARDVDAIARESVSLSKGGRP